MIETTPINKNRPPPKRAPRKKSSTPAAPIQPETAAPVGKTSQNPFPIIGIGASAGGLGAFTALLQNLPTDTGAAFVLVQHLAPTHESVLPAILARATRMPVAEAHDGVRIEPDHVYVIPAHMDLVITDGHLKLLPRAAHPGRMPIDLFFRSLAEVQGEKAIGVVLSGNASDGTQGLKAIKAAGGICIAQDPQSAGYEGMPRSAIAAGCIDAILPPGEIALEIARLTSGTYLRRPGPATAQDALPEPDKGGLDAILGRLKKVSGHDFFGYKKATLLRRVRRRMALLHMEDLAEYARHLEGHPPEIQELYQDLLIHVTSFFRNPETFAALARDVFPRLVGEHSTEAPLRIWVPGCSTGEEAYSIAISLLEGLDGLNINPNIQIFGTDLRESAVEKARAGLYLESIAADVAPARLERFFARVDGHFQISKTVRDLCVFARHDLIRDPPFSRLDFISCRNVLIYLEAQVQRSVMANFHYALNPQGLLLLGSSETVVASSDLFLPVDREHRLYAPQPVVAHTVLGPGAGTYPGRAAFGARPGGATGRDAGGRGEVQREADRILLTRYVPAGVLIDENLEILQFRGDTHPYIQHGPGSASLSLPRMVQKGLLPALREMIQEARVTRAPVRRPGLTFRRREIFQSVDVEVVPVPSRSSAQTCFLVLFTETPAATVVIPSDVPGPGRPRAPRRETDRQIGRLEQELATTQQYLQAVIEDQSSANEELQSANEEVLSSNEELQSLNEELESAKEELQSSNEELTTLNEELQHSNQELAHLGDDLVNLLAGLHIPVLLLGMDLSLRRFTPAAARLMNLLPTDVGRPLGDIRPNFDLPGLETWLLEAIEDVTLIEREVQDRQGIWYSLRIRPYKTRDNRIDGAVLALLDIDALKRSSDEVTRARDFADAIIETVQQPLLVLNAELRVERANRAFYHCFRVDSGETEGRFFYELGNRQWEIAALRTALQSTLSHNLEIRDFEVEHAFPEIGRRTMVLDARRVRRDGTGAEKILLSFEDRTLVRKAEAERSMLVAREQRAARQAEAASRLKDEFLATVSHELRGPLNAMSGWVHVLRSDKADAALTARGLMTIERNIQAQARLVEDLLDAARITAGKLRLIPHVMDLLPVVEAAVETVRAAADAKGVSLVFLHGDPVPAVLGDPDRLQQVAWNLLSNAVKFTLRGGHVEARLSHVEGFVQLCIRDTGQGISPEFLPHVFKRFRQEESSAARSQTGLGLGLSIVRHLCELHGGMVEVVSAGEGQGATFTVFLPVPPLREEGLPGEHDGTSVAGDGWQPLLGLHLLVVEDEASSREMLTALLEQYGAEVIAAASAAEALAELETAIPDLLVSDIGMPGESGYDLIRRVRTFSPERGGNVPALAFTAYSSPQDRADALDAGFQAHLAKLSDPARLVALIRELARKAG